MEDVLHETDRRLSKYNSLEEIRAEDNYMVFYSTVLEKEITEVWEILQKGLLHKDPRVKLSNMKSAKIINELLLLFTFFPELVNKRFTDSHEQLKKETLKDPVARAEFEAFKLQLDIAKQLKVARQQAHLTQDKVAERMDTQKPVVARLEAAGGRGKHSPSIKTLVKYASAVGFVLRIKLVPKRKKQVR